jgi:predicted metal-binding transcription factor (methanogenesis marker protein 9)
MEDDSNVTYLDLLLREQRAKEMVNAARRTYEESKMLADMMCYDICHEQATECLHSAESLLFAAKEHLENIRNLSYNFALKGENNERG